MKASDYVLPRDCDFNDVEYIYFSAPCSPVITNSQFTGVVLNAPSVVEIDGDFKVIVCAAYNYRLGDAFSLDAPFVNSIIFVAVDKTTQEVFSGRVEQFENAQPHPDPAPEDAEVDESRIVGGYVNPDLVETVGLPERPARYVVYATVGTYKSNVVDIEVERAE